MERKKVGHFEITMVGDEQVRAFVPRRLPPEPSLDLSHMQRELERASLALGQLDSESRLLPDPDLFVYAYVRREPNSRRRSRVRNPHSRICSSLSSKGPQVSGATTKLKCRTTSPRWNTDSRELAAVFPSAIVSFARCTESCCAAAAEVGCCPANSAVLKTGLEARDQAMPSMFHRPTRKWNAACPNWNSSFTPRATAYQRWFGQVWRTPSSSPFTHFSTAMGESDGC